MGRRPLPKKLWMSLSGYLLSILLAFTASAAAAGLIPGSNGGFRCGAQRTDCLVLVCVHTAHDDVRSRHLHRTTYMRHLPPGIDVIFVLDVPKNFSHAHAEVLRTENDMFGDLHVVPSRQTGDYGKDSGGSNPVKTAAFLRWVGALNSVAGYRYIAKTDSDGMLNPYALWLKVQELPQTRTVFGRMISGFTGGSFYLFSADVADASMDNVPNEDDLKHPEDWYFFKVATTYVKREEVVETKDLICEPMAKKTVWSCELSDNTLVYHKLKTTEEYEQGWAEFWPHVKAAHHRYRTHIAIS